MTAWLCGWLVMTGWPNVVPVAISQRPTSRSLFSIFIIWFMGHQAIHATSRPDLTKKLLVRIRPPISCITCAGPFTTSTAEYAGQTVRPNPHAAQPAQSPQRLGRPDELAGLLRYVLAFDLQRRGQGRTH